ncbi:MAG: DNA-binding protein [Bosea sp.]|uniref:DNA-binding protein n=1 Tax=Bosea sp. (in: a-proteobacteria) TaxID=1871050 RepID=UPI001AC116D5|nr:DNA-binding protein [Bosea sp. (in: a-proteobacteria)]MBN9467139.1 DNA-binding protein [Bosea sp. (in: a-proteobacteria)]
MPTREEVYEVADQIRDSAKRVSVRSVQKMLVNGGSYRSIGEHLASWKADRSYQHTLESAGLPEALQRQLAALGKVLWEQSMQEATARFEALRASEEGLRDEGLTLADVAESRIAAAERRAEQLACELAVAREQIKGLTRKRRAVSAVGEGSAGIRRDERKLSGKVWDQVMVEIHDWMQRTASKGNGVRSFHPAELLAALPSGLMETATKRGEILDAATLSSRMATRAKHKKFFVREAGTGLFGLLPGYRHAGNR